MSPSQEGIAFATADVGAEGVREHPGRKGARLLLPNPELLRMRAPLLAPTVVVSVLTVATVSATVPLARLAYADHPESLPTITGILWVMAALSPVVALLKGVVLGGVAWSMMVLTGADVRLRSMTSAVVYGQVILGLQSAWVTALLWIRGSGRIHGPADMVLPTGLDALFPDVSSVAGVVAHNVTPFHLAWLVFLSVAFAGIARRSWWRGGLAALSLWVLTTGLGVVRALVV